MRHFGNPVVNQIETMADVEQTLQKLLDKILDEMNYKPRKTEIKAITSGGENFTSVLFHVNVFSPNRDDLKLFAKVACMGEKMRSGHLGDWIFDRERLVYTKLINIYKDIENEMNVPDEHRFRFPKFYGYSAEKGRETVVMENLMESGYQSFDRFKSLDWAQASAAIENLAKFHALSFAYAEHYPEEFEKVILDMKINNDVDGKDEHSKYMFQKMVEIALAAVEKDLHAPIIKVLQNCAENLLKYIGPIGRPVMVHGDYRLSNLLFRKQDDTIDVVSIDYQIVNPGNPACEIIYFIILGTDDKFRKQYFEELLNHYYIKLEEALKRLSVNPLKVYPSQKFYSDIKKVLPYAVMLGAVMLPLITAESENVPTVDIDMDAKDLIVTPNDLWAQRFRGIVDDCITWGVI